MGIKRTIKKAGRAGCNLVRTAWHCTTSLVEAVAAFHDASYEEGFDDATLGKPKNLIITETENEEKEGDEGG